MYNIYVDKTCTPKNQKIAKKLSLCHHAFKKPKKEPSVVKEKIGYNSKVNAVKTSKIHKNAS